MTVFLDVLDVLEIHESRIDLYGGERGVRDMGLLLSAVAQPQAGISNEYLHSDLYEMAAAYLFHIVRNHPFVDGNKRTALAVALVFLDTNGIDIDVDPDWLCAITVAAAEGTMSKETIAVYFSVADSATQRGRMPVNKTAMTVDEYLEFEAQSETRHEYVQGFVFAINAEDEDEK